MKKTAIIWSKGAPETVVKYNTFQKSKENEHFATFFNDDLQAVHLKESDLFDDSRVLKTAFLKNDYSALFILAELNWHNHDLTDFYGIKIAQRLRLHNVKAPVFIYSFLPEAYLVKHQNALIMKSAGHYFIQIPEGYKQQFEIKKLTDMELFDIQLHYCDPAGLIRTIWHQKHAAIQKANLDEGKSYLYGLFSQMKSVEGLNTAMANGINEVKNRLENINDPEELRLFLDEVTERHFTKHLDKNENEFNVVYSGGWDVLVLDDNPDQVETIISALKSVDMNLKIHLATNYDEAVSIIEDDIFNRITLVIVDYVLEDEKGYCKQPQGYAFIEWLNQKERFNEIILLSGQSRTSILSIFKKFGIHVSYKRKTELSGGLFTDFIEEIIEKGNETFEALLCQPVSGSWNFSLANFYKHYRSDPEYKHEEIRISKEATRYIKQIEFYLNLKTGDDVAGWFNTLLSEGIIIPPFKDIRKEKLRYDAKKNLTAPLPLKYEVNDEFYETFKTILVIRRIVIWLKSQRKIKKWATLGDLIFKGILHPAHSDDGNGKNLMTYSCVSDKDFVSGFPSRILVEEKYWLRRLLGVNYNDPESDIVKEKFVFYNLIITKLSQIIETNKISLNDEKFSAIQDMVFIADIKEKKPIERPFSLLSSIIDEEMYFRFLDYFLNHHPSLKKKYFIDRHMNHKQNCLKRTVMKKLPEFIAEMDNLYVERLGTPKDWSKAYKYTKSLQLLFNNHSFIQKPDVIQNHFDFRFELNITNVTEIKLALDCIKKDLGQMQINEIQKIEIETNRLIQEHYGNI